MNAEFEQGVRLIREAYTRRLTGYEQQIQTLKEEKEQLLERNSKLEAAYHDAQLQLQQAQDRIHKLSHFKQTIVDSFSMATSEDLNQRSEHHQSPLLKSELFSSTARDEVDARAYFKSLKRVVTYDEYSQIYALVKQYNDRLVSQSEVLAKVQRILLPKYPVLYEEFKQLIQ